MRTVLATKSQLRVLLGGARSSSLGVRSFSSPSRTTAAWVLGILNSASPHGLPERGKETPPPMWCLCIFLSLLCSSFCFGGKERKREFHFWTKKMRRRMKTWLFMEGLGLWEDDPVSASSPSWSVPRAGPTAVVLLSPHGRISQMLSSSPYPAGAAPRWDPGTCWEVLLCPLSGGGRRPDLSEVEASALTAAERKQRLCGWKSRPEPLTQVTLQVTHSKLQGPKGKGVTLAARSLHPQAYRALPGTLGPLAGTGAESVRLLGVSACGLICLAASPVILGQWYLVETEYSLQA